MTLTTKETAPGRATTGGGKDQQAADIESILDRPTHKIGPYDFESFAHRIIQDCIEQATAAWWLNRAKQLEQAVSKPGDFPGRTRTPEQQAERDQQLRATAFACRARAALIQGGWF